MSGRGDEPLLVLRSFGLVEGYTRRTVGVLTEANLGKTGTARGEEGLLVRSRDKAMKAAKRLAGGQAGSWEDGVEGRRDSRSSCPRAGV